MRYKKFKNAEIEVSQLAVGTWAIGGQNYGKVDKNEAICAIRRMIENGVNLIDTAPCYGNGTSEKIVGEVLKEIPREQVLISTKFGLIPDIYTHGYKKDTSYKNAMREIQSSLMNLETDYIDFYFVHWPDVNTPIDETMAALEEMKRKGYIRYVGVSNFTAEQIKEAEQYIQIDVQQPLYSMVDRGFEDLMSWGYDRGIDSMTYGSMGAGILSGKIRSVPSFEKNDLRLNFYDVYKEPKFSKIMEFFYKQTYYSSGDFDDSRYDPFFAPLVYPGQTVHLSVMPLPGAEMATTAQIYAKNGVTGEVIRGEKVKGDGEWHALSLEIPGGQTGHISEVGIILCGVAKGFAMGDVAAYIDDLYIDGNPDYRLDFGRMKLDSWHVTHQEVPQFAKLKGHSYLGGQYLSLSCADFAEMYTGHHLWNNYRVTAVLKPVTGTEHFVNIRVQGAMRSYAAGFSKNNKLVLRKNYYGYTTLCETDFEWKVDEEYKISLTADGSTISVSVNDKEYLKFTDSDLPLLTGCAGISVEKGSHCLYRDIAITGRE